MSIIADIILERGSFTLDVNLQLPGSGVTALFGRSGCGKTTLLRALAGLERFNGGQICVQGEIWQDNKHFLPVHLRAVGYVFQESSLFPHLNVKHNLLYGFNRLDKSARHIAFDDTVQLLGLDSLMHKFPAQLSGGQRQRVAIGRALLTSPRLLLMDEPMASLDLISKAEILPYIETLHRNLAIPVIYVSHSIQEVCRLADHMVLLENGRVLAQDSLQAVLTRPDLPLAYHDNAAAVLCATMLRHSADHMSELGLEGGQTLLISRQNIMPGAQVRARVLARDVAIALQVPQHISVNNCLPATIRDISDDSHPGHVLLQLDLAGQTILSRISRRSFERLTLAVGLKVFALIKAINLD
ncbi:molybdate transport system ATP-binding protein [Rheinheimera pacifica]|uniref:molybdenum ABC transporter ATP-binding protein n=1 Tax=Rheinheimera pacifica TaxID=173990 RepID=UPI002169A490|nr:molybdenum ABC transporter ATP-binding protein [Rheinheimera pacifica]MCS4309188.1 molybdate transport system ATP-binding protein [Rheinheimera pacifica]